MRSFAQQRWAWAAGVIVLVSTILAAQTSEEPIVRARPAYRASVPVTDPTAAAKAPRAATVGTPEYLIQDRPAELRRDDEIGWFMLEFAPQPDQADLPPQRVLPGPMLAAMERLQEEMGGPTFMVSGESTRYHGHQYILVRNLLVADSPSPPAAPTEAASPPAQTPSQAQPAATASADILQRMMQDLPARPVGLAEPENEQPSAAPSVAPGAGRQTPRADRGDMIIDRLGWIVPSHAQPGWFEFRFVSDNTLADCPLLILPSLLLQRNESAVGKMRMSGEIVRYRGRTYLLPRKLLGERDLGQF